MLVLKVPLIFSSLFNPFSCPMELFLALFSLGEFHDPRLRRNSYKRPGYSSPSDQSERLFMQAYHSVRHDCLSKFTSGGI